MSEETAAGEIQTKAPAISKRCAICDKELEGMLVANDRRSEVGRSVIGFTCEYCGEGYCESTHDKKLKAGFLGLFIHKSTCVKCRQKIGFGDLIVNPKTLPENFDYLAKPEVDPQTKEQNPTGVYFAARKVPESCPACSGSNIIAIERPSISVAGRAVNIVFGVLMFFFLRWLNLEGYFEDWNEVLTLIFQIFVFWAAASCIWYGLTLKPLGRYIIKPITKTHATCQDCGHIWVVS